MSQTQSHEGPPQISSSHDSTPRLALFNPYASVAPETWSIIRQYPEKYPFRGDSHFEYKSLVRAPLEKVWSFFSTPHNIKPLTPPGQKMDVDPACPNIMEPNLTVRLQTRIGPLDMTWYAHYAHIWDEPQNKGFIDIQLRPSRILAIPFRRWCHIHSFAAHPNSSSHTIIYDRIRFQTCFPPGMHLVANWEAKRQLAALFQFRTNQLSQLIAISPP